MKPAPPVINARIGVSITQWRWGPTPSANSRRPLPRIWASSGSGWSQAPSDDFCPWPEGRGGDGRGDGLRVRVRQRRVDWEREHLGADPVGDRARGGICVAESRLARDRNRIVHQRLDAQLRETGLELVARVS